MRLLVATPLYPPDLGGPSTYAKTLEEGLPERGIEVTVVSFSAVRDQPKGVRHIVYFWRVLLAARKADAVLALDPVSVGLPSMLAALLARKPFFVKVVGDYAWEQGRQRFKIWLPLDEFVKTKEVPLPVLLLRFVQGTVVRRAKKILVPSMYLKSIVHAWGIPEERITVIYNAVPKQEPGTLPDQVRRTSSPRIVSSGRLVPWKGMHGLISAMMQIREGVPEASLIIVGDGPDREALSRFARARLGEDGVLFTGALGHADALAVYQAADVFVLNSTYEGLSHVLIEVMALARPIVATRAGGNPELIQHEETGLVISVGDQDALAASVLRLLDDVALRDRVRAAALTKSGEFSRERMLNAVSAFFTNEL